MIRTTRAYLPLLAVLSLYSGGLLAQPQQRPEPAAGPRLIRFAGKLPAAPAATGASAGATFSIYQDETGGTPLWSETQNFEPDADGQYSVLLGAATPGGIPPGIFTASESRWLQVEYQSPGAAISARVLLVSVPYAIKAGDAETLGGRPASAYALAGPSSILAVAPGTALTGDPTTPRLTFNGTPNYLSKFTTATTIGNSAVFENNGAVTIGGATSLAAFTIMGNTPGADFPAAALFNQGGGAGASASLGFFTSSANGGVPQALIRTIDDGSSSGHIGFWTKNPGAPSNPLAERMRITSAGSVGIGTAIPAGKLEVNGNTIIDGTLTVTGNITAPNLGSGGGSGGTGGVVTTTGATNLSVGVGAMPATAGGQNTATGDNALHASTSGSFNAAFGYGALQSNTSGGLNTAVGNAALFNNVAGANNTAVGGDALLSNNASNNTAVGELALYSNVTGANNTAVGQNALTATTVGGGTALGQNALSSNTTGAQNTAAGTTALQSNTTASYNSAFGYGALAANITGGLNTAVGNAALFDNVAGANNTAVGTDALLSNTASNNTAVGELALYANTSGAANTAVGQAALTAATTASNNVAVGQAALSAIATGSGNTAVGAQAIKNLPGTGANNTAVGYVALTTLVGGSGNTAIGAGAIGNVAITSNNTAIGFNTLNEAVGGNNIALGASAGSNITSANNTISIGAAGVNENGSVVIGGDNSSTITLGGQGTNLYVGGFSSTNVVIHGIYPVNAGGPDLAVYANDTGGLVTHSSSRRYKENIVDMATASDGLFRLRPVTFQYKKPKANGSKPLEYGLIAEEVADIFPDLVVRDREGRPDTLDYTKLIPMLVNELQKQNAQVKSDQEKLHAQDQQLRLLEERLTAVEAALQNHGQK